MLAHLGQKPGVQTSIWISHKGGMTQVLGPFLAPSPKGTLARDWILGGNSDWHSDKGCWYCRWWLKPTHWSLIVDKQSKCLPSIHTWVLTGVHLWFSSPSFLSASTWLLGQVAWVTEEGSHRKTLEHASPWPDRTRAVVHTMRLAFGVMSHFLSVVLKCLIPTWLLFTHTKP